MVDLSKISKIGTGTYRMDYQNKSHYEALLTAFENNLNLIDTATNYRGGNSEKLIGKLISNNPKISEKLFIISKTGYIPKKNKTSESLKKFLAENTIERAYINEDFEYSLDTNFLNHQLEQSLKKINRSYIDGYLLQNPERYLQSTNLNNEEKLYKSIEKAFKFLEKKVKEKKIRYYGISSNKMFNPEEEDSIDLNKIIKIAQSISPKNHFKLIQFPFNFKEQSANSKTYNGKSLLEIAKENLLITFSNRPLNMNNKGHEFRFVKYDKKLWETDDELVENELEKIFKLIDNKLIEISNGENNIDDFEPMVIIKRHIKEFQSSESVDSFYSSNVVPFLKMVFNENFNTEIMTKIEFLKDISKKNALKNISTKSKELMSILIEKGVNEKSSYPITACDYYLNKIKIDHVLMGLRKKQYVEELKKFLISYS